MPNSKPVRNLDGLTRKEPLDHRGLARFLQQEAVVPIRRLNHVELDTLAQGAKCRGQLLGAGRRIQPVGTERDEQRSGRYVLEGINKASSSMLPCEIEVRQCSRCVEVGVRVKPSDEGIRLVAQVALDLELGVRQRVTNVLREL